MVLIIDGDRGLEQSLYDLLRGRGIEVHHAVAGRDGLQILQDVRPRVVVLELLLPDLPGLEVLRQIRQSPRSADVPVLVFTSSVSTSDRSAAQALGVSGYVRKGTESLEQVAGRIEALL